MNTHTHTHTHTKTKNKKQKTKPQEKIIVKKLQIDIQELNF